MVTRTPVPKRVQRAGTEDPCRIQIFPSELGWMAAEWRGSSLYRFTFGHETPAAAREALPGATDEMDDAEEGDFAAEERRLAAFAFRMQQFAAHGEDDLRDVPLAFDRFTSFQRRVLERCRKIPAGRVMTYAELARAAGCPGGARAVGNVMASNPFPLIVPCHRVIGSAGGLGGYSGPAGLPLKLRLLEREGVDGMRLKRS